MERDFKGVWIPKEIYLDESLNWTEKILLIEIDSLDGENGCFATNDHFAKHLMISKGRVSKLISKLNTLGYITIKFIYRENSKEIEKRIIHSNIKAWLETTRGYSQEQLGGIVVNDYRGIVENDQDNNTLFNNTINNTSNNKKKKKESSLDLIINNYTSNLDLKETLQDFLKMRKAQKKVMTDRALKTLLKKLDTLATTDEEKIERLEESICNCWLTVYPKKQYNIPSNKNKKQEEQTEWHGVWDVEKDMNSEW